MDGPTPTRSARSSKAEASKATLRFFSVMSNQSSVSVMGDKIYQLLVTDH